MRTDDPHRQPREAGSPGERAPLFGKWRYWYVLTAGALIVYIFALTVFSRIFS